jgi:hypothetical protein
MAQARIDPSAVAQLTKRLAEAYQAGPAQVVRQQMQAEAPVLTGVMRAEHRVDPPKRQADGYHIIFRTEARSREGYPYPIAVHNGRGPVFPRRAKALRWVTRAGVVVFAKRSGPAAPNPWMWRTFARIGFKQVRRPNARPVGFGQRSLSR